MLFKIQDTFFITKSWPQGMMGDESDTNKTNDMKTFFIGTSKPRDLERYNRYSYGNASKSLCLSKFNISFYER
jgi:hypothetical protein